MWKKRILTVTCLLGLAGMSQAGLLFAQRAVRIKLATLAPKGSSYHQILMAMGEKWRNAPGGGVNLTIYPGGHMGGEADMVRKMRVGQLHAAMLTVTGLSDIDTSVRALQNMPMMFRSLEEVDFVREKLRPELERRFQEKGFVVIFWGDAGWVRFFSRTPVLRPDDLKRLKVFTWAGDNNQVDIMKAAGYQPVPLETNDILPGLQTGLIQAVPTVPFYALSGQFYGPASHMLELNWAPLVGGAVVTRKIWESIPDATRKALLEAAREAGEQIKGRSRAEGEESVEAMKKRGLTVHPVSAEAAAEWRASAESVYPQIRGRIVPAEMFDQVQQLLNEYRTSSGKSAR